MAGNSFGTIFRITTFGESHGAGIGVVIDGCPSNIELDIAKISTQLARRRPGQSDLVSTRNEPDAFEILSGVIVNTTTGAPLTLWIANKDQKPADYDHLRKAYRPSHADFTYEAKYGIRDVRGGGRSSARETAARVAAGAVAEQVLQQSGIEVLAYVDSVSDIHLEHQNPEWTRHDVDSNPVRCPDVVIAEKMQTRIEQVRDEGDTVGGTIKCIVRNCPVGLGEPVFDKLEADLAKALLSINACKGFEIGSGFAGSTMRGSEHNDVFFTDKEDQVRTQTNHSGGVQGGLSNGMEIIVRAAFKPVSTLMQSQKSIDTDGKPIEIEGKGRHDPCVVPRAVPIVESMVALTVLDHLMRAKAVRVME